MVILYQIFLKGFNYLDLIVQMTTVYSNWYVIDKSFSALGFLNTIFSKFIFLDTGFFKFTINLISPLSSDIK
jgi:hypothetical protein